MTRLHTLSYALPAISLYVYMVLSSVEFGASIFRVWPGLLRRNETVGKYLNPIWEATNVFLVYFIICMMTFFPKASGRFGTDLLWVVFPALAFFGLRVIGMLLIYYGEVKSRAADLLLLAGSFLTPVTFSLALVYMIAGSWRRFLMTPMYVTLALTIVSTVVLAATTFFRWYGKEAGNRALAQLTGYSLITSVASFVAFFSLIDHELPHLVETIDRPLWLVGGIALSASAFVYAEDGRKPLASFIGTCGLIATYFFPLAFWQLPYLIYPVFTVENAATDPASFAFMTTASLFGLALVIPATVLLFKMFVFGKEARRR